MSATAKRIVVKIIVVGLLLSVFLFFRSCALDILRIKTGTRDCREIFWNEIGSFEYLADKITEIFDQAKEECPELNRIVVNTYYKGNVLLVTGYGGDETLFDVDYPVSEKCIEHYKKIHGYFYESRMGEDYFRIEAHDGYVIFSGWYTIIYHENGVMPKWAYAERLTYRWFQT